MTLKSITAAICLLGLPTLTHAATVLDLHSGATDPTTTGWSTIGFPSNGTATSGAVLDDLGTGVDAWRVEDRGLTKGDLGWYSYDLTAEQTTNALTYGWKMSVNMRTVDVPDTVSASDASPFFGFRDGTRSAQVHLGTEADGDPVALYVNGVTNPTATVQGAGNGYNLYEMIFTPGAGISLSIDGTQYLTNLGTIAVSRPTARVIFGTGSSYTQGQGHFASVTFETFEPAPVVPLPASLPMLAGGLVIAGVVARRRRAS